MTGKKSDVEVLIREVSDDPWAAKPLSLAGTARLIEFLGAFLGDAAERTQIELALRSGEGEEIFVNPILTLLRVFDEERLAELLSIVTHQTPAWIKKNWRLVRATEAIKDFIEREDMGEILGNLGESRDLLSGVLADGNVGSQVSSTNSLPSTEEPQITG